MKRNIGPYLSRIMLFAKERHPFPVSSVEIDGLFDIKECTSASTITSWRNHLKRDGLICRSYGWILTELGEEVAAKVAQNHKIDPREIARGIDTLS